MNLYGRHDGKLRGADASLIAIIEEAIDETVAPPIPPEPVEPVSAEGFLADAAAFLRTRPDAADLLRRLQKMVAAGAPLPSELPQSAPETAPATVPNATPTAAPESAPSADADSPSRNDRNAV
jgi:hypothetical protein